jgi:hypothetical protein
MQFWLQEIHKNIDNFFSLSKVKLVYFGVIFIANKTGNVTLRCIPETTDAVKKQ